MSTIEYMEVRTRRGRGDSIGAIGFLDDQWVVIAAYHDDADEDDSGDVSVGEWIASKTFMGTPGRASYRVLKHACLDQAILDRDMSLWIELKAKTVELLHDVAVQGAYVAWFRPFIGAGCGALSSVLVGKHIIKQFAVKKGMERLVKEAIQRAL
jgi:hypothetical protein